MIARNIDEPRAFAPFTEQFLDNIIMLLRPIPAAAQAPAVNHIANQIDRIGIVGFKKIQQQMGLTALGSKMEIGQEQRAELSLVLSVGHDACLPFCKMLTKNAA